MREHAMVFGQEGMKVLTAAVATALLLCALVHSPVRAAVNGAATRMPEYRDSAAGQAESESFLTRADFAAADALHAALARRLSTRSPVLVASLVELNDFGQTSTFGRLVSQQVASRLGQHGYRVMDVRLGAELVSRRHEGEFMMTREAAKMLETRYAAQAVLLGNYVVARGEVFVSLRVLRLDDRSIVAAHEFSVPNTGAVRALLSTPKPFDSGLWSRYAQRHRVFAPGESAVPEVPVQREEAGDTVTGGFAPFK